MKCDQMKQQCDELNLIEFTRNTTMTNGQIYVSACMYCYLL